MALDRRYLGSDEARTQALPLLDYQWTNGWFAGLRRGLGYNFSGSDQADYGLRLSADFGVDATQAALSGDPVYAPEGGLRDVSAELSLTYRWSERTHITGSLTARALRADAKDSPLTRQANIGTVALAVTRPF